MAAESVPSSKTLSKQKGQFIKPLCEVKLSKVVCETQATKAKEAVYAVVLNTQSRRTFRGLSGKRAGFPFASSAPTIRLWQQLHVTCTQ